MPLRKDAVPINGQRLKWALHLRGLSNREAGRLVAKRWWGAKARASDQNAVGERIRQIVGGQKHCEGDLVRQLSIVLHVPERWLKGEEQLPMPIIRSRRDPDASLQAQLARYRLMEELEPAIGRETDPEHRLILLQLLTQFCEPLLWMQALLSWRSDAGLGTEPIRSHGEAAEHLVEAMLHVLRPWIKGRAQLNLDALAHIVTAWRPDSAPLIYELGEVDQ